MATGQLASPQAAPPEPKNSPARKDFTRRKSYKRLLSRGDSVVSLSSFTSMESVNSDPGRVVEVGNLRFLKDGEMSDGQSSILGRGSFASVRLAWRKTHTKSHTKRLSSISDVSEREGGNESFASSMDAPPSPMADESELDVKNFPEFDATEENGSKEELVAVKIFQKSILRDCKTMSQDSSHHLQVRTALENVEREIAVMKMIQHPNLVSLYEVIDSEEMEKLYMVIEYIPLGEIMSYVPKTDRYRRRERREGEPELKGVTADGYFDEEHCALYFVDLLHGLAHLHGHRICHRLVDVS
jgi:serine/threonine protein kinase